MKAEIELSLDSKGEPVINIVHHDRSNAIEQLLLKKFIEEAKIHGIKLLEIGGTFQVGTTNSKVAYEISIDSKKQSQP